MIKVACAMSWLRPRPCPNLPPRQNRLQFWSMTVLPLSEVKARLSEIADEVGRTHERVHITKNGKEYVVLLAAEDLESIEATLELLSDPAAQERVAQSRDEIARGVGISIAEVGRSLEGRFRKHRP